MRGKLILWATGSILFLTGCTTARVAYNPYRKIPKEKLQQDFMLFRHILEEGHPSLYWYTPKSVVDFYFNATYARITDSMTEPRFRNLLSYVTSKFNCGHTTVRYSKKYAKYLDTVKMPQFPLSIKLWKDTAVVYANLNRKDTILTRGTVLTSINGKAISYYRDSLFQFLSMDGTSIIHKYQALSNLGSFSGWYRNIFGLQNRFSIGYLDPEGIAKTVVIPVYNPRRDTGSRPELPQFIRPGPRERKRMSLLEARNVQIDTALSTAYFTLNTFVRGHGLTGFIRKTFKVLHQHHIRHLVIDVRTNGGGNVGVSNLLTEYIVSHPFKLADSLYAINTQSRYGRYIQHYFFDRLSMVFTTKKQKDGRFHFGYFERHYFSPKKHFHYNGNVYVLTGGNSFSATTLFADEIKGQPNVLLVGEETGGGAYGNTAWQIPDVTLPNTGIRFRLPRFRLVVNKNFIKNGKGILPDVFAGPSVESIRNGTDPKLEKVKQLIMQKDSADGLHHQ